MLTGGTDPLILVSFTFLMHKGSSLAIEAAESLVGVLLILHTCSVLSKGEVLVFIAGPLSSWKFSCVTNQAEDECCHQHRKFPDRRTEVHLGNFEMRGNPGDLGRLVTNHQCDVVDERNNTIILEKQNGRTSPALKLSVVQFGS